MEEEGKGESREEENRRKEENRWRSRKATQRVKFIVRDIYITVIIASD